MNLTCPCGCEYLETTPVIKGNGDMTPIAIVTCLRCGKRRYWTNNEGRFEPDEVVKAWIGEST